MRGTKFAATIAVALAGYVVPLHGQDQWRFGVKVGPTVSSVSTDLDHIDPQRRDGFSGIVFAKWDVGAPVRLVGEAGYAERGYKGEGTICRDEPSSCSSWTYSRPFRYVSLASLIESPITSLGSTELYLLAGPRFNVLLCCSETGEPEPGYGYAENTWEATAGAGAAMTRGRLPLLLEARVNLGLSDALEGDWAEPAYHRSFDVMLGFAF